MSMQIVLKDLSKKYANHYVIKDFSYTFQNGNTYAILGSNGSGKSTLVKMLSGLHTASKGEIGFSKDEKKIPVEQVFRHISLAAPWSDVIEDLTLTECIRFYFKFRQPLHGISENELIALSTLESSKNKFIHQYSSGMKQRVRLLLAFFTDSDLLLLDEPTSNMDAASKQWYRSLIDKYANGRTMIVASNHLPEEYDFCKEIIELK